MSQEEIYKKMVDKSVSYYRIGEINKAKSMLRKAIYFCPDYTDAYRILGDIYIASNMSDEAIDVYEYALRISPYNASCYFNLYKAKPNDDVSYKYLKMAIVTSPDNWELMAFLGFEHHKKGEAKIAADNYRRSLIVNPLNAPIFWNLSRIRFENDDVEEWCQIMRNAIILSPENGRYYEGLARGLVESSEWKFASDIISRSETISGKSMCEELKRKRVSRSSVYIQRKSSRVYDCFTFFNEVDLLEIRLHELYSQVDQFFIVEGTKTFSNKQKPLFFEENKKRFEEFIDKITYIVLDDYPDFTNAWDYEFLQRNETACVLDFSMPQDFIFLSDVDEIPNKYSMSRAISSNNPKVFRQSPHAYYLNCVVQSVPYWLGTRMIRAKDFCLSPQALRSTKRLENIHDGGWHFGYLGGVDAIIRKIESFAHQELNVDSFKDPERIKSSIISGSGIFGERFNVGKIDRSYPEYIVNNMNKFRNIILES